MHAIKALVPAVPPWALVKLISLVASCMLPSAHARYAPVCFRQHTHHSLFRNSSAEWYPSPLDAVRTLRMRT